MSQLTVTFSGDKTTAPVLPRDVLYLDRWLALFVVARARVGDTANDDVLIAAVNYAVAKTP
jgi:hypothetical protein